MNIAQGLLLVCLGAGLIFLAKADRNGAPKAFIQKSQLLEAFYPALCLSLIVIGLALMFFGGCPSSDNLRLVRRFAKGGSGSSGVRV